ncbi:MAG: hypothetical protein KGD64_00870 [Candidatus Heimdallarchaeota archaeon]|nr:hypothetical protein [Candidatus Heimdallarchaeota archaeon]
MKATIHLEEHVEIKIGPKEEVFSTESKGVLKVINPSKSTTLWGIELKADFNDDVDEIPITNIPYVEAGKEHIVEYATKNDPQIEIKEIFDTSFDGNEVNHLNKDLIYNVDQTLSFQLTVTNKYDTKIKNLAVEKHLPLDTREIRAIEPFPGDITIVEGERVVNWVIPELEAGRVAIVTIACTINPTNVQPYKSGIITARCETEIKMSSLKPVLDGDCDNVDLGVEVIETAEPNQWKLSMGLRNASEFEILLKDVKIEVNGEEKYFKEPMLELEGNLDEPIWKEQITVESITFPEITKKFDYTALFKITEHSTITYEKESDQIYIVKVGMSKLFDPEEVTTYAASDIRAIIDITNTGSATVGKIEIEDTIPSYFEIEEVSAESAGREVELVFLERPKEEPKPVIEDREKATFEDIERDDDYVEEDVQDEDVREYLESISEGIDKERIYHYTIENFKLESGQTIKIQTKGIADKPRIEGSHSAPATVKAYAEHPAKPFVIDAKADGKIPSIVVQFKQRSYKATSIFTKQTDDSYNIEIPITNTGDVPLDNVMLIQPIFSAEYVSHTPPTVDVKIESFSVKSHIKRINPGETVVINLSIKADGPLRQQQATIRIED